MRKRTTIELTANARTVLEHRYLFKDGQGSVSETPEQMFERVAVAIAAAEKKPAREKMAEAFFDLMASGRFLPNSPTLMNSGKPNAQLSACFVIPIRDSLDGIFDSLKYAAKIHQSGGGTGFSFSELRAGGSVVKTTQGVASGPVSFIKIYDAATETIKQGGARRGANMAILRVDHPDIFEFVDSKRDHSSILNFNISVGVTDEFMLAVQGGSPFALRDPRTGKPIKEISARDLFARMTQAAWECGDPGVVFLDRINLFNPTPREGRMESTNPCVTGDTRVWVEKKGLIPISELVGFTPFVGADVDGSATYRLVTQVIRTGVRPVFTLKTLEGYELKLTDDHRVMTDRGDIPAGELEPGMKIRLAERQDAVVDFESAECRIGEVVGWLTGDGHFTIHEQGKPTAVLNFYGEDKRDAAPRLLATIQNLLGDSSLRCNEVSSRDLAYIRSARLRRALAEMGVNENCKTHAPEAVFRGSDDFLAGYLRGLFSADGSFQGTLAKGLSVRLSSNKESLLRDTQLLLLRLGVKSNLYLNRRSEQVRKMPDGKGGLREYVCAANHELIISKSSLRTFEKLVGFVIEVKTKKLQEALSSYRRGPYREEFYATFQDLQLEGEEEVYDLTEPATNHFYANGLLVHNCGEQPLLPFESCNLGSLNLGRYVESGDVNWKALRADAQAAVRFLDNVIDINVYPVKQSEKITLKNRKIGLGVMGFADLLLMLNLPYDSADAQELGERLMGFIDREAKAASAQLAKERGSFPNWKGSLWERLGYPKLRNATVSTVAPTGTISMIAGASSGIEPIFSGIFQRNVLSGETLLEVHPAVEKIFRAKGISDEELSRLTDADISGVIGKAWTPAAAVSVENHIRMQARFQRHSDSAVSKTINLPESATVEHVSEAYLMAYRMGCKGITVYRDRSRPSQVLEKLSPPAQAVVKAEGEFCPSC